MATKRTVETPGAAQVAAGNLPPVPSEFDPHDDDTPQVAALKAQLRAAHEQLNATKLPQAVFEPVTPKGAEAIEASPYHSQGITSTELIRRIDAGEAKEPTVSVLCADGYYTPRS